MERRAKILLVDDDADFVESTRTVLESKAYDVVVAINGDQALSKARDEKPDLIILDVIMPIEDGFTAAEHINQDKELSKIPILMLTSYSQRGPGTSIPRSKGMSLEAEDYIEKPISPENLLATVARHLKKAGF